MRRRAFLTTVAAAGLLPHVALRAGAQAPAPKRELLKLGVASYSLRKFPFDKALEMAKACDTRYINFKDFHMPRTEPLEATRATRAKAEAAGFVILGGGTIDLKKPDEAAIRKDFEYAMAGGFPLIVAAPSLESLDIVEKCAKEFQIKVAIHNHGPEDKFFPAPRDAYQAVRSRDRRLGLCMDVGHALRAGADPVRDAREMKDRLYDIHMKDLRSRDDRGSQTEVGKGVLDVPGLFRALRETGYQGHVNLEYEINAKDPLPGMKESFAYMRGVLAGLDGTKASS
jgi:sugar phosphate isomerase/epimerase